MNYNHTADRITKILKKYGSLCLFEVKEKSVYNPLTNEYENENRTIGGYAVRENYNNDIIDGSLIQAGDVRFVCSFKQKPKIGNILKFGKDTYTIINVETINPNGEIDVVYIIQARV